MNFILFRYKKKIKNQHEFKIPFSNVHSLDELDGSAIDGIILQLLLLLILIESIAISASDPPPT